MKKLIEGIVNFQKGLTREHKDFFKNLSQKQEPDALFIACSDSRVVPNQFASTNPGDLFVLRNIGNLMPPPCENKESSAVSALEYAALTLKVSDIIVCGHSECGGMKALIAGIDKTSNPMLASWLVHAQEAVNRLHAGIKFSSTLQDYDTLSQINVLLQMEHIQQYDFIQKLLAKKTLRLHGWWFDIAKAQVYHYEKDLNKFVLIDEKEAKKLLAELHFDMQANSARHFVKESIL